MDIGYRYRAAPDVHNTGEEVVSSAESRLGAKAMKDKMDMLIENGTSTQTTLADSQQVVKGARVFNVPQPCRDDI